MAEEELPEGSGDAEDSGPKKRRVGRNIALALCAVAEKKAIGYHVDYKTLAAKFNMTPPSLRLLWSQYKKGKLELPPEIEATSFVVSDRELHVRAREITRRDLALTLSAYESAVFTAEDAIQRGGEKPGKKHAPCTPIKNLDEILKPVHFLRRQLMGCLEVIAKSDKGFDGYLEALSNQSALQEKSATPALTASDADAMASPAPIPAIQNLNDREGLLRELREAREKAITVEAEVSRVEPRERNGG